MIGHLRTIGRDWSRRSVRLFSQSAEQPKVIQVPVLDPHVKEQFEQGLKPRKHSGKRKSTARNLPTHLEHAALRIIKSNIPD